MPDLNASGKKGGLGTSLVQSLAKQLDAQVAIASDAHGTSVSITHATFKSKPLKAACIGSQIAGDEIAGRTR